MAEEPIPPECRASDLDGDFKTKTRLLASLLCSGGRNEQVVSLVAQLVSRASRIRAGDQHVEPLFLLMRTLDRFRVKPDYTSLNAARDLLSIEGVRQSISPTGILEWARYWSVRSWSRRPELHFSTTEPREFARGLCSVHFEYSDAPDYAELVAQCLRCQVDHASCPNSTAAVRAEAEAESMFLAGAGFTRAAAVVRSLTVMPATETESQYPSGATAEADDEEMESSTANVFRKANGVWTLRYDGKPVHLMHSDGLAYIHFLIENEGREIDVKDVEALSISTPGITQQPPAVDQGARKDLDAAIEMVEAHLAEAVSHSDLAEQERLEAELMELREWQQRDQGLGTRSRRLDPDGERRRGRVRQAIKLALGKIEKSHPSLGRHLREAVKRPSGKAPRYQPTEPTHWVLR